MTTPGEDKQSHSLLEQLRGLRNAPIWRRLFGGLALPLRAALFLFRNRSLWTLVVIPALINISLFAGALYFGFSHLGTLAEMIWAEPEVSVWYDWLARILWYVLLGLLGILAVGVTYISVLLVGGIIASPFNDALSERVEQILISDSDSFGRDESFFWSALRAVGSNIFILGSYVVVMIPILLLNLVPVAGQIAATLLGAAVSSLFLAMEYIDGAADRRGRDLRSKFELIENNRTVSFGFGLGASLLFWLPLLNFLTIPIAVAGGTALGIVLDEWERRTP